MSVRLSLNKMALAIHAWRLRSLLMCHPPAAEVREKISQATKLAMQRPEVIEKLRLVRRNQLHSDETKVRMGFNLSVCLSVCNVLDLGPGCSACSATSACLCLPVAPIAFSVRRGAQRPICLSSQ
jgi:hypothetical protein